MSRNIGIEITMGFLENLVLELLRAPNKYWYWHENLRIAHVCSAKPHLLPLLPNFYMKDCNIEIRDDLHFPT